MPTNNPAISVSGYRADTLRDVTVCFQHNGIQIDIHASNAIASSELGAEHEAARAFVLGAAEALVAALKRG
jgi:hypothetical protein